MVNYVRTMLLNLAPISVGGVLEDYIPASFVPVTLPKTLDNNRLLLLGGDTDRETLNATVAAILAVCDAHPDLYAALRYHDTRVTHRNTYSAATVTGYNFATAADLIDPTIVFRPNVNTYETKIYNVWLDAPVNADRAAAAAIGLAWRIADYRRSRGLDGGA